MSFNENLNRPKDARKLAILLENERKQALSVINEISDLTEQRYIIGAKESLKRVSGDVKHIKETIDSMLNVTSSTHGSLFDPVACIREAFDNGIWDLNSAYQRLVLACYSPRMFGVDEDTKKVMKALNLDTEKIPVLEAEIVRLTKLKFYLQSYDIETIRKAEE